DATVINKAERDAEVSIREVIEAKAPVSVLDLDLASSITGETDAGRGLVELPWKLQAVSDGEGKALAFSHRSDDLLVELPRRLTPGEKVELRFELKGDVLYRPHGDSYWEMQ